MKRASWAIRARMAPEQRLTLFSRVIHFYETHQVNGTHDGFV